MNPDGARTLVVGCDWAGRSAPEELLGERERAHAAGLSGGRRAEWVRTRLTAKAAVRWATGVPGAQILPGPGGAPLLWGAPPGLVVSLAHSGHLAACAVGYGEPGRPVVGVDVEPVDARNGILLKRLLGPDETPCVVPGRPRRPLPPGLLATVLAACKEAALKAYRGPSPSLRDYPLSRGADGRLRVRVAGARHGELRVWWSCRAGRVTAVCAPGRLPPVRRTVPADRVLAALRDARPRPPEH
ncbi:4'-phosphopantetheinyl transferase family protein [Streptomyces sp. NPDC127190]|uniref:4'-phosphopantetheinyl transferase family protein n=1 Tax=unclassified Streptomyces TaxID=2593676 RepID=UPI0036285304